MPAPSTQRGQLAWWLGACLLAVGVAGSSADAIYHLVAYELTDPELSQTALALPVMRKFQGPDLMLLLPSIGAFFCGLGLYAIAAVQVGLTPRASRAALSAE